MAYEIITIEPSVSDGGHSQGDVMFNLMEVKMPARSCKLINIFMEVAAGGGEDNTKIGILFFQKNTQPTLGSLKATANIDATDFVNNKYIGQAFLMLDADGSLDLDVIATTALYYQCAANTGTSNTAEAGAAKNVVLKGEAGSNVIYAAGVLHASGGSMDLDGTDNVKIHLHVEY
tara:strand:+ start:10 stop:534 length:525 start_codon:yes stop_codon:yes gene_type:complete